MATKHGKVVTLHEGLPPINSYNPLNICSRESIWQIMNIKPPLSRCVWSQDLSGWWHVARSSNLWIRVTPQWSGHVRSHGKLNALYLHRQKTRGHQTKQGAELQWEVPILNAIGPLDYVINVRSLDNFTLLQELWSVNLAGC